MAAKGGAGVSRRSEERFPWKETERYGFQYG
jgi:hypothetical protein